MVTIVCYSELMFIKNHIHYTKFIVYLLLFISIVGCTSEPRNLGSDKQQMNNVFT